MHVGGHIREAFQEAAEFSIFWEEGLSLDTRLDVEEPFFQGQPLSKLLGQLWACTDCMPSHLRTDVREAFDMEDEPFTYAQAAQRIHRQLSLIPV